MLGFAYLIISEIGHHHHHDNTNGGGGGHQTVFHGGCEEVILFSFWKIQSFFGLLYLPLLLVNDND
jgi:hypothetical protein